MTDELKPIPTTDTIWVGPLSIAGELGFDGYWSANPTIGLDETPYIRADRSQALAAAAYRKAAEVCGHNISTEADDDLAVMIEENILALTPADAEAALEAYVRERVNEALDKEDVEIKAAVLILVRAVDLGIVEGNKTTAALDLLRAKFSPNEIATGVLAPSEQ